MGLEGPEVSAHAAESYLDFIDDAHRASFAHMTIGSRQIAWRQYHLPGHTEQALAKEGRGLNCACLHLPDRLVNMTRVLFTPARIVPPVAAAIIVGHRSNNHVRGPALAARTVELVRAHLDQARRIAVIGSLQHNHAPAAGMRARQTQGQLIGLTPRVDEETYSQRFRQCGAEPLGVIDDPIVQIARVRVEDRHLPLRRAYHSRMAVANMGHVVHQIEKTPAGVIVKMLRVSANDLKRRLVGQAQVRTQALAPRWEQGAVILAAAAKRLFRNAKNQVWIR